MLCTLTNRDDVDFELSEKIIDEQSRLVGTRLADIGKHITGLVVLIQRGDEYIIPDGSVTLKLGDHVLINRDFS